MQIKLNVSEHLLTLAGTSMLAGGSENVDTIKVTFDSTWNGFGKLAVFNTEKTDSTNVAIDTDGIATIPSLKSKKYLRIGIVGIMNEQTYTTNMIKVYVEDGAVKSESEAPAADVYHQILSMFGEMTTTLSNIIDDSAPASTRTYSSNKIEKLTTNLNRATMIAEGKTTYGGGFRLYSMGSLLIVENIAGTLATSPIEATLFTYSDKYPAVASDQTQKVGAGISITLTANRELKYSFSGGSVESGMELFFADSVAEDTQINELANKVSAIQSDFSNYNAINYLENIKNAEETKAGLTFNATSDTVSVSGTSTSTAVFRIFDSNTSFVDGIKPGETYRVCVKNSTKYVSFQLLSYAGSELTTLVDSVMDIDKKVTIPDSATGLLLRLRCPGGKTVSGNVSYYISKVLSNADLSDRADETDEEIFKMSQKIQQTERDLVDITEVEKSINLFNVETIDVQMRLYPDTGKLQPQQNSGWISSDFIEIDSSRQYLITNIYNNGRTTINITGRLCFYSSKSEDGFISGLSNASTTFTKSVLRNAIPENTKYIKISLSISNSEPASLELAKEKEIMIFEIPSDSTESIITKPYVDFFEKKVVKTDKTLSKSNIPADAEVVGDKIEKLSDVIYNNKEEVDNKISNLIVTKTGYNLLNHVEKGKILNPTTGIVTDYATFSTSDFVEITEGKGYVITKYYDGGINQRTNSNASRVCWYDANKVYIGGSENVRADPDTNVPITFPQNAKYIRICFSVTTDLETMKYMLLEVYGTVYNTQYLPYLPYGYSENIPTKPKASFEEYRYLCFSFLNTVNQLNILGSDNLIDFTPIKMSAFIASKLFMASKTKGGEKVVFASSVRDPAIIKYKEWYYIVYTVGSFYYDYNVIGMCRTKDFVDYEELDLIEVHCNFDTIRLWAPCWFRDIDGKTYITVSAADDNGVFKTVIAEYNFDENTLGEGTVIIDDGGIDYHIFRHKGWYYAFGGNNKIRKSNTLLSLWDDSTIINTALPIGYEAHYPVVLDDGSLRLFRQELQAKFEHAYMTYSDQTFDDIDNGKCGDVLYCRFNGNLQSDGEPIHMHWTIYDRFCRNGNNNNYIN